MSSIPQPHIEIRQRDYRLTLVTPPASEPLLLGDVKQLLGVTLPADDDVLNGHITGGRQDIETATGWKFLTQTWEYAIEQFPIRDRIVLPIRPVQSVTSIIYTDAAGNPSTVSPSIYTLYPNGGGAPEIVLKMNQVWPTNLLNPGFNVVVRFVAGAADVSQVPAWALRALRLYIQRQWDLDLIARNREPGTSPRTYAHQQVYDSLIREHRYD